MKTINTSNAPEALGPYSHAVEINGLVYTSGQIPLNVDGEIVSEDVQAQTKQVLENVKAVLKEALNELQPMEAEARCEARYQRLMKFGSDNLGLVS